MSDFCNELISIIIPVYNSGLYLEKCLDGAINQTYKNIELILVENGSSDNSPEICRRYALIDERIKVITIKNKGVSYARNEGLKIVRGKYLTFIDADDSVEPTYIQTLFETITRGGVDMGVIYSYCDGEERNAYDEKTSDYYYFTARQAIECIYNRTYFLGFVWGKIYKTQLLKDIVFDEAIYNCEDELFVTEYLLRCNRVCYTPEKLYNYVVYSESVSRGRVDEKKLTMFKSKKSAEILIESHFGHGAALCVQKNTTISLLGMAGKLAYCNTAERKENGRYLKSILKQTYSCKVRKSLNRKERFKADVMSICLPLYWAFIRLHNSKNR